MMMYKIIKQQRKIKLDWEESLRKKYKEDDGFCFYSLEEISFILGLSDSGIKNIEIPNSIPCIKNKLVGAWYRKIFFQDIVNFLEK